MNPGRMAAKTPRVLLIDDDPAVTAALALRLREYDVECCAASFGAQGISLAISERPDVIVTDLRMPSGDGDYVVECLRGRVDTCDIPIIVLTGVREQSLEHWLLALGVEHYFHKPASLEALIEALDSYIALEPTANS